MSTPRRQKRTPTPPEPPEVTARAKQLGDAHVVRYWVVLSYRDIVDLLDGQMSAAVRKQLMKHAKPAAAESHAEYLSRVAEYDVEVPA